MHAGCRLLQPGASGSGSGLARSHDNCSRSDDSGRRGQLALTFGTLRDGSFKRQQIQHLCTTRHGLHGTFEPDTAFVGAFVDAFA